MKNRGNMGPHIGRSIPTSPQWKTIQSPQEKCYFVGIIQILPTLAYKVLLKLKVQASSNLWLSRCSSSVREQRAFSNPTHLWFPLWLIRCRPIFFLLKRAGHRSHWTYCSGCLWCLCVFNCFILRNVS